MRVFTPIKLRIDTAEALQLVIGNRFTRPLRGDRPQKVIFRQILTVDILFEYGILPAIKYKWG